MTVDVELPSSRFEYLSKVGVWLDSEMPNAPLPSPQRWTLGEDSTGTRWGIRFADEMDATLFCLRWGGANAV